MTALDYFPPNRTEGLTRLAAFLPKAGKDYAARRNYDLGAGHHTHVSTLSPYIRHRLLSEEDVLQSVLGRYSLSSAEKFVQEVYWRTYWKGWLEMRPTVWNAYQQDLQRAWDDVQTQSGLRQSWEAACTGQTGIACFDHWAHELCETGYLHNHARMWFASIWIFTLKLPWVLGADFFLRHLLDGDPASNTLSWRWVGGLQTQGKTYLARTSNISKFTEGRFHPKWQLASQAQPLPATPHPERKAIPAPQHPDVARKTAVLLHEDDLSPSFLINGFKDPLPTMVLRCEANITPLQLAHHKSAFLDGAIEDCLTRYQAKLIPEKNQGMTADQVANWIATTGVEQVITAYAPVGPTATHLQDIAERIDVPLVRVQRTFDSTAWPHATHGFFRFKDRIPELAKTLINASAA